MNIVQIPIDQLLPADYNPRSITPVQFERLQESIRTFGFAEPVIINTHPGRENIIIGGHMRVEAARALGWTEVPCVQVDLDEQKERLLNIALNRIHGEWDQDKLQELVVKLQQDGADLKLSGLEEDELVKLIDEQVPLNMPDLENQPVQTKSITIYLAPELMDELVDIIGTYPGSTISDKTLALAKSAGKAPEHD